MWVFVPSKRSVKSAAMTSNVLGTWAMAADLTDRFEGTNTHIITLQKCPGPKMRFKIPRFEGTTTTKHTKKKKTTRNNKNETQSKNKKTNTTKHKNKTQTTTSTTTTKHKQQHQQQHNNTQKQ
jgi:hypothetical protein